MKNVHMCYIRVTEGKIENLKKEGKMRLSNLIRFIPVSPTFRNSYSCYSHYVKFRTTYLYSIVCFRIILLLHSKSINFGISLIA